MKNHWQLPKRGPPMEKACSRNAQKPLKFSNLNGPGPNLNDTRHRSAKQIPTSATTRFTLIDLAGNPHTHPCSMCLALFLGWRGAQFVHLRYRERALCVEERAPDALHRAWKDLPRFR